MEHRKPGPSGPNETWQEGDHYHHPLGMCLDLTQEQADDLNKQIAEVKAKAAVGEMARQQYDPTRACIKCGCKFPADTLYKGEQADCWDEHGLTEHFDRMCRNCGYTWAESIVI